MKARPLRPTAVAAARDVLDRARVRDPGDIHPEAIAGMCGARILYGRLDTAVASLVRGNGRAIIQLDERSRGTPRERFSTLHETAHLEMHADADHLMRCTEENGNRGRAGWLLEEEANHFATEASMPERFATPRCAALRPTVDDVERFAATFRASFTAAAIRYVQLSPSPCAVVFAVPGAASGAGVVKWSVESASFPGRMSRRQPLPPSSVAARVLRETRRRSPCALVVASGAWGTPLPLLEHALPLGPHVGVMSWLSEA